MSHTIGTRRCITRNYTETDVFDYQSRADTKLPQRNTHQIHVINFFVLRFHYSMLKKHEQIVTLKKIPKIKYSFYE